MSRQTDLNINLHVRRTLVRHWIDLGVLSIRTVNGRVMVRGRLDRVRGNAGGLTPAIVDTIFRELRNNREVRRVDAEFENWTDRGGGWRHIEDRSPQTFTEEPESEEAKTYEIAESLEENE